MRHFSKFLNNNIMKHPHTLCGIKACWVVLGDGTRLSIQAGYHNYCSPKVDFKHPQFQRYKSFEIGFPSKVIEELLPYAEDPETPCDTVYGWVPKKVIAGVIRKHGGIRGFIDPTIK